MGVGERGLREGRFLMCYIKEFDIHPIRVRTPLRGYTPIGNMIKFEL